MNIARKLLLETVTAICVLAEPLAAAATDPASAYPEVRTQFGARLFSAEEIHAGERAWAALTGETGALRGRGGDAASYWLADWLRRERAALREMHAEGLYANPYARLSAAARAVVDRNTDAEMVRDSYDPATNTVTVSVERGEAISEAGRHYMFLFGDAAGYAPMRARHALPANALPDPRERRALAGYLFWSSWSSWSSAARPAHSAHSRPD